MCLRLIYYIKFQSTPPVKAATSRWRMMGFGGTISIHAAREGGDREIMPYYNQLYKFQSTPPVKAATRTC